MTSTHPINDDLHELLREDPELLRYFKEAVGESIGASLRLAREQTGLTQQDVARNMGISRSRVAQIESTQGVALSLDVLNRYATALGYRLEIDIVDPDTDEPVVGIYVVQVPGNALSHVDEPEAPSLVGQGAPAIWQQTRTPETGFVELANSKAAKDRTYAKAA